MINIKITKHAEARIKERCGLPKKAIERSIEIALHKGVSHNETTGRLKKYMDWLYLSYGFAGGIKLYNDKAYIFTKSNMLITVFPLPNGYKKAVNKIIKRKEVQ